MGSKTTMLYLSPMASLLATAVSWYLSHTSLIIPDTYWDHILCPGRLLWHVMCQITPQAKNIHCTFFGQFLENITYVHIPLLCTCGQTGTRSERGLWIPGVDLVTLSCTAPTSVWWFPALELVPDLQVLHWATAEPSPCSCLSPSSQGLCTNLSKFFPGLSTTRTPHDHTKYSCKHRESRMTAGSCRVGEGWQLLSHQNWKHSWNYSHCWLSTAWATYRKYPPSICLACGQVQMKLLGDRNLWHKPWCFLRGNVAMRPGVHEGLRGTKSI